MLLDTNISVLTSFMIPLFLAAPASRVRRAWDLMGNINTKWANVVYLFGKKYFSYRSQVFLLISFLGTFFKLLELSRFITLLYRSSRPEVFCKKCVLENSAKFTELHLCQSLFFNKVEAYNFIKKETLGQVFSCEFC